MKGDQLLQEWKQAKQTCQKVIQISIASNLYGTVVGKQSGQEFMKVYDVVYRLCSNRETQETRVVMVYKDYKEMIKNTLLKLSKQLQKQRDICKLKLLKKIWDAFEDIIKRLKHMFAYLNRPFHIKEGKLEDLDRTGMVLISQTFFNEHCLQQFNTIYFKTLHKIRESHNYTESQPLKDYVDILYRIHLRLTKKQNKRARTVYTDFQVKYLHQAQQFYKFHYNILKQFSPSEYFIEANEIFHRQKKLTFECFAINSQNLINNVFSKEFLVEYKEKLIKSKNGLKSILQNRQSQTIKVITELYKQLTNSIDGFKEPFQSFIYEEFATILQESRSELSLLNPKNSRLQFYISLIKRLIGRYSELIQILKTSFMKYNQFISYYKNGVERAFSRNVLSPQIEQILAIFIDSQMKINYQSQDQLLDAIKNTLLIFECMENKDVFLMKYLQNLCKNILVISIQGLSNHEAFIYALKMHSGIRVTEKLETIIDEYKLSLEQDKVSMNMENQEVTFRQITQQNRLPYSMNIRIFSEGVWPNQNIITIQADKLPEMLYFGVKCIKQFQTRTLNKKVLKISLLDNRVRWMYHFETDEDQNSQQIQNKNSPYCYFDTNGVQAVLLYYIYQRRPQKVGIDLLRQMFPQIKPAIMETNLNKMSDLNQTQLLIKNQEEGGHMYYSFNKNMKTKKRIINYDALVIQKSETEQLFKNKQLGRDREFTIDANIAKLMKSKKVLNFDKLAQQIVKIIKVFVPNLKDIKSSVERLLIKQLLIRDQKDKSVIRYKD